MVDLGEETPSGVKEVWERTVVLTFDRRGAPSITGPAGGGRGLACEIHITPVLDAGQLVGLRIAFPDQAEQVGEEVRDQVFHELRATLEEMESTHHELQATMADLEARLRELTVRNDDLRGVNEDLRRQLGESGI